MLAAIIQARAFDALLWGAAALALLRLSRSLPFWAALATSASVMVLAALLGGPGGLLGSSALVLPCVIVRGQRWRAAVAGTGSPVGNAGGPLSRLYVPFTSAEAALIGLLTLAGSLGTTVGPLPGYWLAAVSAGLTGLAAAVVASATTELDPSTRYDLLRLQPEPPGAATPAGLTLRGGAGGLAVAAILPALAMRWHLIGPGEASLVTLGALIGALIGPRLAAGLTASTGPSTGADTDSIDAPARASATGRLITTATIAAVGAACAAALVAFLP